MTESSESQWEYSIPGILIKTIPWLAVGVGRSPRKGGDELSALRYEVERLKSENTILRRRFCGNHRSRHTWREKLHILWHMEIFNVPRRHVESVFGIARSTYYRWLPLVEDGGLAGKRAGGKSPPNRTGDEIAALVWRIFDTNSLLGREKIAQMIQKLNVFLSPSAVWNILRRGRPKRPEAEKSAAVGSEESEAETLAYPGIISKYPNHVWSIDLTVVKRWLLWPTYVLVGIDHFSRKIVCVSPVEGSNSGWTLEALEEAIREHGKPKHLVTHRGTVFASNAFADFLHRWKIKHRLGAVGKHGSIAVTERAIKTMKLDWLSRVPVIRGFGHLTDLCQGFLDWYNDWRPHSTIGGATPNDVFRQRRWRRPERRAKTVPETIGVKHWHETRVTAFRLKDAT
jgi:transposase InsO family protein